MRRTFEVIITIDGDLVLHYICIHVDNEMILFVAASNTSMSLIGGPGTSTGKTVFGCLIAT